MTAWGKIWHEDWGPQRKHEFSDSWLMLHSRPEWPRVGFVGTVWCNYGSNWFTYYGKGVYERNGGTGIYLVEEKWWWGCFLIVRALVCERESGMDAKGVSPRLVRWLPLFFSKPHFNETSQSGKLAGRKIWKLARKEGPAADALLSFLSQGSEWRMI